MNHFPHWVRIGLKAVAIQAIVFIVCAFIGGIGVGLLLSSSNGSVDAPVITKLFAAFLLYFIPGQRLLSLVPSASDGFQMGMFVSVFVLYSFIAFAIGALIGTLRRS